jgi:ABC-type nitrate/sulfonate/bicarbonate transport system substrate-binding protein
MLAWFALSLVLLFPLSSSAQKLQRVRVALSTPTPHMAPLWVGKDKQFFEKHGLDVQLILVNSGSLGGANVSGRRAADDR